jgi:TM2 domain-containing membrane protein YozV
METLNLNANPALDPHLLVAPPLESDKKSPGVAWLLSFFCPGAGQLYCGAQARGILTLVIFWTATLVALATKPPALAWGIALRYALALWCFATLDAFFTAREFNAGIAPMLEGANPRVAAILNLITKGWGYFYLGKKGQGIAVFIALVAFDGSARALKGRPRLWMAGLEEAVLICFCVHAYLLGKRQLQSILPTSGVNHDRFSEGLPLASSAFVAANYLLLVSLGLMLPNYKPIDGSKASIQQTATAILYRNATYGIAVEFPLGWELSYPTPNEFVMGTRPGGGCTVQFMAAAELPIVSRQADIRDIIRILTSKGYVYEQERSTHLGDLAASEVSFRHKRQSDSEIDQSYLFAKKGLSSYILITSMTEDVRSKCEELSERIRSTVRIR